jgi:hypothetical protein
MRNSLPEESQRIVRTSTQSLTDNLVQRVQAAGDSDDALDLIYTEIDCLLRGASFERVDEILGAVDPSTMVITSLLAFVSITYAPRERLRSRARFVARIREHLTSVDPARVDALLAGLE